MTKLHVRQAGMSINVLSWIFDKYATNRRNHYLNCNSYPNRCVLFTNGSFHWCWSPSWLHYSLSFSTVMPTNSATSSSLAVRPCSWDNIFLALLIRDITSYKWIWSTEHRVNTPCRRQQHDFLKWKRSTHFQQMSMLQDLPNHWNQSEGLTLMPEDIENFFPNIVMLMTHMDLNTSLCPSNMSTTDYWFTKHMFWKQRRISSHAWMTTKNWKQARGSTTYW